MNTSSLKHIIFLVSNDLTFDQRMNRICSSLSSNNYNVTLCGREKSGSWKLIDKKYKQHRVNTFVESGPLFYLFLNLQFFLFLLFKKFDGVCAIDLDTAPAAWLISKIRQKVLIYDAHELYTEVPELLVHPRKKKIWERVAKMIIPASDLIKFSKA